MKSVEMLFPLTEASKDNTIFEEFFKVKKNHPFKTMIQQSSNQNTYV